ncbi:AraC family transcriptional regulator [Corallococcus exercitus]|uniref:AraC family transcriptional regulator n=1 Tax=Corallococcus exercitus TaxID=2316736 RepID=A0A3A8HKT1_9BACT|nr:AraC family transcriptional regulator [Corallococcus exercitus]NOK38142.1 AraC family transcriptional regulator [Corallococcus exercitus]RKG71939.1 AraC family transcriptional regulator [Corallococcus exercitus]
MVDPLAEVVTLLQPGAPFSKFVSAAGKWRVRRAEAGRPFYCAVLMGRSRLAIDGREPVILEKGDFVLIPAAFDFTTSSIEPPKGRHETPRMVLPDGEIRNGDFQGPPDVRMMVGYCAFASPDASLLVSLLPQFVHIRGEQRLSTLVELVREESRERRPAREVMLARLMEVLLLEALRSTARTEASPGLLRGLADERLAVAIRRMHEHPTRAWTVAQLAKEAALSRSAFFERFSRAVGVTPMEYLLGWRMAKAKDLLRRKKEITVAEVAEQVGYSSASTFSVAFTRHVGLPPTHYAREQVAP